MEFTFPKVGINVLRMHRGTARCVGINMASWIVFSVPFVAVCITSVVDGIVLRRSLFLVS